MATQGAEPTSSFSLITTREAILHIEFGHWSFNLDWDGGYFQRVHFWSFESATAVGYDCPLGSSRLGDESDEVINECWSISRIPLDNCRHAAVERGLLHSRFYAVQETICITI